MVEVTLGNRVTRREGFRGDVKGRKSERINIRMKRRSHIWTARYVIAQISKIKWKFDDG